MNRILLASCTAALLYVPSPCASQWEFQQLPSSLYLVDIYFADSLQGWIATSGGIYHTENEGVSWVLQDSNSTSHLAGTSILNCWAVGSAGVRHTSDGGKHWLPVSLTPFLDSAEAPGSVTFRDSLTGWVTTTRRHFTQYWILRTVDGGQTWLPAQIPVRGRLCSFGDNLNGWISDQSTLIYSTHDGGVSWDSLANIGYILNSDFELVTKEFGWVIADGPICTAGAVMTTDGGKSWYVGFDLSCLNAGFSFTSIDDGWVAFADYWSRLAISHTTDQGRSWTTELQYIDLSFIIRKILFTDARHGWVIGDHGSILHTSTGILTSVPEKKEPQGYSLSQNYPNPFNAATQIRYALETTQHVKLSVYNLLGQEVAVLVNGIQDAGYKTVSFNANDLPTGIFTCRIMAGTFSDVKKMLLLR